MHPTYCVHHPRRARAGVVLVGLALLFPGTAAAAKFHARVSGFGFADVSAFDLHIAATRLDLDYDDSGADETMRLRRIGIGFFESISDSSRAGVRLGRIGFDQSGRAATEGRDPAGYFAGLEFNGTWPSHSRIRASLDAGWRYTSVDDVDDDGTVELDWQTLELRPAVWLAVTPRVVLRLGASALAVDGSERVRDPARDTVDFEAAESAGGFASLEYHRSDGDVVGMRLRGGNPSGLYVAFEHRY